MRIAVFNLNETHRDPRVRRVCTTLAAAGHEVRVFEMRPANKPLHESFGTFDVERVNIPQSYTVEDMAAIERACPAAGELLRHCDPAVLDGPGGHRFGVMLRRFAHRLYSLVRRPSAAPEPPRKFDPTQEVLALRSILLIDHALYVAAERWRPDVAWCNDLDSLLTGFMLAQRFDIPVVYDAHEIYPEQLAEHMRSDIWHGFYTRLERRLLQHTDVRLTVCDSIGAYFRQEYGSGPVTTVRNVPARRFLADESVLARRNQPVRFLYHGAYFQYRGLDEILEVAARVERGTFVFRGVGAYGEVLAARCAERRLGDRVRFVPPVGVDDLIPTAIENDVGLNPFVSVCKNTEVALPNKFFEYMMAGLAVASADLVEMRALTDQLQIGVLFDAADTESVAVALNRLANDPELLHACRRRAWVAARDEFHWENEEKKLLAAVAAIS